MASKIKRIPDKQNRRRIFISVTEKAKIYRDEYDRVSEQMNKLFYKGFTAEQIVDFVNSLRKIKENLDKKI